MTDQELTAYCIEWAHWCRTRKYFAPPVPPNILAQLQPRRVSLTEPDGPMSADMAYFNMAVHSLAEDSPEDALCFTLYHYHGFRPVKAMAAALEIGTRTFYDRMERFARRAHKAAATIKRVHLEHTKPKYFLPPYVVIRTLASLCGERYPKSVPVADENNAFGMNLALTDFSLRTYAAFDFSNTPMLHAEIIAHGSGDVFKVSFGYEDLIRSLDDFSERYLLPIAKQYIEKCG